MPSTGPSPRSESRGRRSSDTTASSITVMAAMRHRRIELTTNIRTDPALLDVAGAMKSLPDVSFGRETRPAVFVVWPGGEGFSESREAHQYTTPRSRSAQRWHVWASCIHSGGFVLPQRAQVR